MLERFLTYILWSFFKLFIRPTTILLSSLKIRCLFDRPPFLLSPLKMSTPNEDIRRRQFDLLGHIGRHLTDFLELRFLFFAGPSFLHCHSGINVALWHAVHTQRDSPKILQKYDFIVIINGFLTLILIRLILFLEVLWSVLWSFNYLVLYSLTIKTTLYETECCLMSLSVI